MNAIADAALEAQLRQDATVIEPDLEETLAWLRSYDLDAHAERDAAPFAASEITNPDPLVSQRAEAGPDRSA